MFVSLAALFLNTASNYNGLHPKKDITNYADMVAFAAHAHTPDGTAALAANLMTSGQFVTALVAMLIGINLVTIEFAERTVTSTFLVTPRRERVIAAKAAAAAGLGAACWLVSTAINAVATPIFLSSQHLNASIAGWTVTRAVLLSLAAFVVWAIFGLGLGALIRGNAVSVAAGIGIYAGGFIAAQAVVGGLIVLFRQDWLLSALVVSPAVASKVMITPGSAFQHNVS